MSGDIYALFNIGDFTCFQQNISTFQPGASFSGTSGTPAPGSAGAGGTSGSTGASTGASTGGAGGSSGRSGSTTGSTAGARSGDPGVLRRGCCGKRSRGCRKLIEWNMQVLINCCECSLEGQSNRISTLEKKDLWKRSVQLQCPQTHTNVIRLIICIHMSHAPSVSMWCWTSIPLLNLHPPLLPGDVKVLMSPQLTATKSRLSRIGPCQSWTAASSMVSHLPNLWVGVWVPKVFCMILWHWIVELVVDLFSNSPHPSSSKLPPIPPFQISTHHMQKLREVDCIIATRVSEGHQRLPEDGEVPASKGMAWVWIFTLQKTWRSPSFFQGWDVIIPWRVQ